MLLGERSVSLILFLLFCFTFLIIEGDKKLAFSESDLISYDTPLAPNDVRIGPHYIEIPLGKIFLIRKGQLYGAIKLTKFWESRKNYDEYALYDSWYQNDGTGDYSNKNVKFKTGKASFKLYGIGRFSFNLGNPDIECGIFRLLWSGIGMVYFFGHAQKDGDYGIELAPTKWTDIKEVNTFDPHLKWYKYDENRPRKDIPVDKLW